MKSHEIVELAELISRFKLKDLSVNTIVDIVNFKFEIKPWTEKHNTYITELAKKYEIREIVPGFYDFNGHDKQKEITDSINSINNTEIILTKDSHFMTMEEIIIASKESVSEIELEFLINTLSKKEKKKEIKKDNPEKLKAAK